MQAVHALKFRSGLAVNEVMQERTVAQGGLSTQLIKR
jgi:hypothetical protein